MAQSYPLILLSLVTLQILGCSADVEQLVQVFNAAVDSLAPPEKAAKFKVFLMSISSAVLSVQRNSSHFSLSTQISSH